jgi:hypothetical protein
MSLLLAILAAPNTDAQKLTPPIRILSIARSARPRSGNPQSTVPNPQ